jgi:hypothetical protein
MKLERPDVYLLVFGVAVIFAVFMFYSALLAPRDRYVGYQAGAYFYILDQATGDLRGCVAGDCEAVQRWRTISAKDKPARPEP